MESKSLYKQGSHGTYGAFELEITVGATLLPELDQPEIRDAAYEAAMLIHKAVMAASIQVNPEAMENAKKERQDLLGLFPEPIFVEEIPNGYCSDWCCRHLPWFVVTTKAGRFKIGWRKRVINIEWTETRGTKTSAELFKDIDVTKGERMIHAWSPEDAKYYIETILSSAVKP